MCRAGPSAPIATGEDSRVDCPGRSGSRGTPADGTQLRVGAGDIVVGSDAGFGGTRSRVQGGGAVVAVAWRAAGLEPAAGLACMFACVVTTPLGLLVVPLVYSTCGVV